MVVTGDHSAVLNAYVEILRASAGSRLIGLLPHRRPHASQVFEAISADGGLTRVIFRAGGRAERFPSDFMFQLTEEEWAQISGKDPRSDA